jgi:hypothetical protein
MTRMAAEVPGGLPSALSAVPGAVPGALSAAPLPAAIVVTSSTPLWYLIRATGLVAPVLLILSMASGLLSSVRYARPAASRPAGPLDRVAFSTVSYRR